MTLVDTAEEVRKMFVAARRKQDPRTRAQGYAKSGKTRHDCRRHSSPASPRTKQSIGGEYERDVAFRQLGVMDSSHHHTDDEHVERGADAESDQNGAWDVLAWLDDLFGSVRDELETDIGNVDQLHRRNEGAPPHGGQWFEIGGLDIGDE